MVAPPRGIYMHGSTQGVQAGCQCKRCDTKRDQLNFQTPRGVRPTKMRKMGKAHVVLDGVLASTNDGEVRVASSQMPTGRVHITVHMTEPMWEQVQKNDSMITVLQSYISDAEVNVPKTTMVPLGWADQMDKLAGRPKAPRAIGPAAGPDRMEILVTQMEAMVAGHASGEVKDEELIKYYGHARDLMASQRAAFARAEGLFEVMQAQIIKAFGTGA